LKVQPDLSAPPRLGIAQTLERLRRQPPLHPEDHDLMQPRTGGVELGLQIGLGGLWPRTSLGGSDGARAIGDELELAAIGSCHTTVQPQIAPRI
jgi:hypothetical protein